MKIVGQESYVCCLIFILLFCSVWWSTGGMGIRDCAKKECQEEASVDEDSLDKNLMSVASSLLYCYSVVCWWSTPSRVLEIVLRRSVKKRHQ